MSFFDDEDAIEEVPRRSTRSSTPPRARSGSGSSGGAGGSRPPRSGPPRRDSDPAIERRRWAAVGVIVVVVILMILLISSCQASATRNSLEDYANSVSRLIASSDATGATVFADLRGSSGSISSALATPLQSAKAQLDTAKGLAVPGQMTDAQRNFVLAMRMRYDGISQIADNVDKVTASSAAVASAGIGKVASGTARFYASDVVYIDYAARDIVEALHGDNISPAGRINKGQFLTELGWLDESFLEKTLGATVSNGGSTTNGATASKDAAAKCTGSPCIHGSSINAASVGSNTLTTTATNTVAASPAPTFSLSFTNGGTYDEYNVACKVSVEGGPSGTGTVSEVTPGETSDCTVKLPSAVQPGTYTVTATIEAVPGETNTANNSLTYQVMFS